MLKLLAIMSNREKSIAGEYYHVYNRGVDKRIIFTDERDYQRFLSSLIAFNNIEPIGSIYEQSFVKNKNKIKPLIRIICYCLNPNHFHLIISPLADGGVESFIQKIGTGYTMYFNGRQKRSGRLFQGPYKVKHISDNGYLLHLSAYVNLNNLVHRLGGRASKSSWSEYCGEVNGGLCNKRIILDQFENNREYEEFAQEIVTEVSIRRQEDKELDSLLLE